MATGDVAHTSKFSKSWIMLDAETAVADGHWVDVSDYDELSLDVTMGVGTLQVRGANQPVVPADTAVGRAIGADITASGMVQIAIRPRWIKVQVSADTSGTHNAWLIARHRARG